VTVMRSFLDQLRDALLQGAALAYAGINVGCEHTPEPPKSQPDAALETDAAQTLVPYAIDRIDCYGEDHGNGTFGYHGRCCATARCYTPSDGAACASRARGVVSGLPTGSGSCDCAMTAGLSETDQGPYAPNPEHTPASEGSCCYLVAAIKCDGRPLIVDSAAVLAVLVVRDDWMSFT
jgi:hypothetical protein